VATNNYKIAAAFLLSSICAYSQVAPLDPRWIVTPNLNDLDGTNLPPASTALVKSLSDAAEYVTRWRLPADAAGWTKRRPEVERAFRKAIGLEVLPARTPLNPRITGTHDFGSYVMENLVFDSRPNFPVTANLYRPKSAPAGRRAAVVCPIGHYPEYGKSVGEIQARSIKLAEMGFVVLTYDAIGHGERMIPGNVHHEGGYALLPLGETIAGWMVWDSMRAIDYLLTLPDVDAARIGITGNSGGGLNTLFTTAIDTRIHAAVVVGYTFEFNNWLKYAGSHCTCTQLPGLFRAMEWFEIAGLIAPRPLMMLQGDHDDIFPISGARRSGHRTEALYGLLGHADQARFVEVPGQPHSYSRYYRERMYGFMAQHLLGQGNGEPIPEGDVQPLKETDPRLLADREGTILPHSATVVDLARSRALASVPKMPAVRVRQWVRDLTAPPEPQLHLLKSELAQKLPVPGGMLEKMFYLSEDGEYIPSLLWLPQGTARQTIVIADSRGKQAVAESGLIEPLLAAGFAVFAPDLRGRGETMGQVGTKQTNNFRLIGNEILFGEPLAGRRAFDLVRGVDYLQLRKDTPTNNLAMIGIGEEGLPALLAAVADSRIQRLGIAGYVHSYVSLMQTMSIQNKNDLVARWNSAERRGLINAAGYDVDLGSVIPGMAAITDVPDLISLIAPRRVLFCQARDNESQMTKRFQHVAGKIRYEPRTKLDAALLLNWLQDVAN
jgi:cephalosporin-C deacetylase-like acetyl esterase